MAARVEGIIERTNVNQLFLDSGAYSLYMSQANNKVKGSKYAYFDTKEFWTYVDSYAKFCQKYAKYLDYYATVDAIGNPEITWKVQKYLEDEYGLDPVPVIHAGTSLVWLEKYLEEGYDYIGIGTPSADLGPNFIYWLNKFFTRICPAPTYLPIIGVHGFAMTSYDLMIRYPWRSVDSASWAKAAAYGNCFVPHFRGTEFTFEESPYNVCLSVKSPSAKLKGKHYSTFSKNEQKTIRDWFVKIDIPFGEVDAEGEEIVRGVINHYGTRAIANMRFFVEFCNWLPAYPWPFRVTTKRSFF